MGNIVLGTAVWVVVLFGTQKLGREVAVSIAWIVGVITGALAVTYL